MVNNKRSRGLRCVILGSIFALIAGACNSLRALACMGKSYPFKLKGDAQLQQLKFTALVNGILIQDGSKAYWYNFEQNWKTIKDNKFLDMDIGQIQAVSPTSPLSVKVEKTNPQTGLATFYKDGKPIFTSEIKISASGFQEATNKVTFRAKTGASKTLRVSGQFGMRGGPGEEAESEFNVESGAVVAGGGHAGCGGSSKGDGWELDKSSTLIDNTTPNNANSNGTPAGV